MPYADPRRQAERYHADPEPYRTRARDNYARDPGPARERARQARDQARADREQAAAEQAAMAAAAEQVAVEVAAELRRTVPVPVPYDGDLSWQQLAACAGMDVELFLERRVGREVRAACLRCPVRAECLGMALAFPGVEAVGMWGGTTAKDRRKIRAAARARDTDVTHERAEASGE